MMIIPHNSGNFYFSNKLLNEIGFMFITYGRGQKLYQNSQNETHVEHISASVTDEAAIAICSKQNKFTIRTT